MSPPHKELHRTFNAQKKVLAEKVKKVARAVAEKVEEAYFKKVSPFFSLLGNEITNTGCYRKLKEVVKHPKIQAMGRAGKIALAAVGRVGKIALASVKPCKARKERFFSGFFEGSHKYEGDFQEYLRVSRELNRREELVECAQLIIRTCGKNRNRTLGKNWLIRKAKAYATNSGVDYIPILEDIDVYTHDRTKSADILNMIGEIIEDAERFVNENLETSSNSKEFNRKVAAKSDFCKDSTKTKFEKKLFIELVEEMAMKKVKSKLTEKVKRINH